MDQSTWIEAHRGRRELTKMLRAATQVGAVANMSALLMKQMLEDAEQQGAALSFDTSTVEDQGMLAGSNQDWVLTLVVTRFP